MAAPQLVQFYISATWEVFGIKAFVPSKHYGRFLVVEDDLRAINAEPKDYAYTVLRALKKWATSKGLKCVTEPIFCGEWAWKKYLKIHNSASVEMQASDEGELLYNELMVARRYIEYHLDGTAVRLGEVVDELRPLLSHSWLEVYNTKKRTKLEGQALDALCEQYGIKNADDYTHLIGALLWKRRTNMNVHSG